MAAQNGQWIRTEKRFAIYRRDRFHCVYCGADLFDAPGQDITLDHVTPRELGGTNHETNLVTACRSCNCAKQDKTLRQWVRYLTRRGRDATKTSNRVRLAIKRALVWE